MSSNKPTLALTMGDPRGIGPEIIIKAWPALSRMAKPFIFGHRNILKEAATLVGKSFLPDKFIFEPQFKVDRKSPKKQCGQASLAYIQEAVQAVRSDFCDAIVTAPICKEHIKMAGSRYPGHTEMLAGLSQSQSKTFLMMVGKRLRVSLITLHEPLSRVPKILNKPLILQSIVLTHQVLRERFKIRSPKLALAGLNPHAGERGFFGREENNFFIPALSAARKKGINVTGPHPGDTVFYKALQGKFDAVVSPYHDQGLIPIKLLHFEDAVNMTLGLPFVRTSVDHGTAFDIAWKGIANPKSLIAAGKLAARLVSRP